MYKGGGGVARWLALLLVLLLPACSSPSGLRYNLKQGDTFQYWYHEVMEYQGKDVAINRVEVQYRITVTVAAVDAATARLTLSFDDARIRTTTASGTDEWESKQAQQVELQVRATTGEVLGQNGTASFPLAGATLDPVKSFRQALQRYPDKPPQSGDAWPAAVHAELASELTSSFAASIRYDGEEQRQGQQVARLLVTGEGALRQGSGRLAVRSASYVSLRTGMPVYEQGEGALETDTLTLKSSSTLTQTQ